ncbi:MAG TPA: signal recognition particle protein [Fimbriimonadales bacterium]|nr:signal recognition particle protein [Fimbriimonadales bacterium]
MFDTLTHKITEIFARLGRKGRLSAQDVEDALRELRISLLEADVNLEVARSLISSVREKAVGEEILKTFTASETILKILYEEIVRLLGEEEVRFQWSSKPPTNVLLCGLQGSGKTTTAVKLALWLKKKDKKPLLAACDLQRPAAIHQLQILGESAGIPVYADLQARNAVEVARRALSYAQDHFHDVVIMDTAGRLQIDEPLMQELQAIKDATSPSEILLVADSTTGQEAVNIAREFNNRLDLTGLIFTKLDGDTRGGAVLSIKAITGKPVRFIGTGEQLDSLEPFVGERIAQRILGQGDILTLLEKAREAVDREEIRKIQTLTKTGKFNFEDLLAQFRTIRKMGSLRSIMKLIPGMSSMPSEVMDNLDEKGLKRIEAMILSMTPAERQNPDILSASRKRRIASGSGCTIQELNRLIKQLEEVRKQMKTFTRLQETRAKHKIRR